MHEDAQRAMGIMHMVLKLHAKPCTRVATTRTRDGLCRKTWMLIEGLCRTFQFHSRTVLS